MTQSQYHRIVFCLMVCSLVLAAVRVSLADTQSLQQLSGKIVFQAEHDGDWEIYAINANGTRLIQLTENEFADEQPCWSPDGLRIAFASNRDGHYEIYTMNADGTGEQRLTHQSADAKEPAWSPDGTQIAFTSYSRTQNEFHLYIMNSDGTALQQLSEIPFYSKQPRWSPDASRLAFSAAQYYLDWGIHTLDIKTRQIERLTGSGSSRPAWSPDGAQLAYVTERPYLPSTIMTTNLTNGAVRTILAAEDLRTLHFTWSPDGEYLVYPQAQSDDPPNWQLITMRAADGEVAQFAKYPVQGLWPDWVAGEISEEVFTQRGVPWRLQYVYESEYSLSAAGGIRENADALNGKAILGVAGDQAGFMAYGPYKQFPPGDYAVSFRLKTPTVEKKKNPVVRIEVVAVKSGVPLAERILYGGDFLKKKQYQLFELEYSLDHAEELEFRVFFFAQATVSLDRIALSGVVRGER